MNKKILIANREYSSYKIIDIDTEELIENVEINAFDKKIFNNDILKIDNIKYIEVQTSQVRNALKIAGVLILEKNKTYGRNSKGKLLYKVIPDDTHLPYFIVPYELKMGFSKKFINKYITFRFDNWLSKHPMGNIIDTLGEVNNLDVFYEYQLYCKSLHISLTKFTNETRKILNKNTKTDYIDYILKNKDFNVIDRLSPYIFTIDSSTSTDFDDGLSIEYKDNIYKVSIYISNVFLWLETLKLWDSFTQRVSTIYLPDRKRPMLPTILSDTLCSLQENQLRFALCLDVYIDENGKFIDTEKYTFKNCIINVSKNFAHGTKELQKSEQYQNLFQLTKKLDKSTKSSHDVVSYWMVVMNMYTARVMNYNKIGIFRTAFIKNKELVNDIPSSLSGDSLLAIKLWNNSVGKYVLYEEGIELEHELIKNSLFNTNCMNSYLHITSPIRRLVDLLNQIILFQELKIVNGISDSALSFLNKWILQLEYINISMRCIRRVQVDCNTLARFYNESELLEHIYNGIVFDKVLRTDGTYSYMVYLELFKLLCRINTPTDLSNYSKQDFKIYLFEDEDKVKRKIRLQLL